MPNLNRNGRAAQQRALHVPSAALRTLLLAASFAATIVSLPARAQDAAASEPALQEVVITGSRIPVPVGVNSTSPIQSVTSQDITASGKSDTFDLIMQLPQNINNAGVDLGNSSNPLNAAGGVTNADLRGLGPQRTLVLVDGRRLGAGDSSSSNNNPAPDLDQIPAPLIERVDVVTGGASAVYGSDAMAGVVNFVMKKNFQGVQVDGKYGFFLHSNGDTALQSRVNASGTVSPTGTAEDGYKRDFSVIMGTNTNDGAGNITAYFVFHDQDPVPGSHRDFADCLLKTIKPGTDYGCANSANSNQFVVGVTPYAVVGTNFVPWSATANTSPPPGFNSNGYEYLQRQDTRYNAGVLAHLDLNDAIRPYLQFTFMDDRSREIVGPSGLFENGNTQTANNDYLVNCSNPLLSAQEAAILCTPQQIALDKSTLLANGGAAAGATAELNIGRRNVEGGGRDSFFEHTNYRIVGGLEGDLGEAWKYDAYSQYYYTQFYTSNAQFLNYASIDNALLVTGTAANPVCIGSPAPTGCVPYNIFTQGGVTQAQIGYLAVPGTAFGTNSEQILHADATGDLGKYHIASPLANSGVGVNVGVEYRFENINYLPDASEQSGVLAGNNPVSPVEGSYHVKEGFIEMRAPLVQDKPFAHDLSIDAGYRYSDYSTAAGVTTTYKFELQYAPIPDVRLRYSYDRAVRAPNLIDLLAPQAYGQQSVLGVDPCAGATPTATLAQCQRTGVTQAQYGNIQQCVAGQCGQVTGGNLNLKPEEADTYSLGLSVTPTALPGLSATIDYWHIELFKVLGAPLPPDVIFNGCLTGIDPTYCSSIVRTAAGALTGATVAGGGYIFQGTVNTQSQVVSGIDLQAAYHYMLPGAWGSLESTFNGSWLQQTTFTPNAAAHTYDCAGLFGATCNNGVNPRWRHNVRVTWDTPWKVQASVQWRYIGGTSFDNNSADPTLNFAELGYRSSINAEVPSYSYLDLTAAVQVWRGIEVRAGINNVLDKEPPVIPSSGITGTGTPNTYPTYDILGRELFVGFRAKF